MQETGNLSFPFLDAPFLPLCLCSDPLDAVREGQGAKRIRPAPPDLIFTSSWTHLPFEHYATTVTRWTFRTGSGSKCG